jgi:pimeloyl-ACP methyl ester carboxylesterase
VLIINRMTNVRFYGVKPYKAAIIHGGPGALGTVAAIAHELAREYGVIEPLQTKSSISELLMELDEIISVNCNEPVTLIGHSWGAWLAFIYAAEYPGKVKQIILVGSGPFEMKYVADIEKNRMEHLSESEGTEYNALLASLNSDKTTDKDSLMKRLGELVEKADNYCAFEIESDKVDCLPACGDMYSSIWNEAAKLRESGELLKFADKITCPVVAIHGEYDPHPLDGVILPLEKRAQNFTLYTLEKCGHDPWKEKYAHERFYEIIRKELER